jgi:hypothetical protein
LINRFELTRLFAYRFAHNREGAFPMFPGKLRNTCGSFAFRSLHIKSAFACDYNISSPYFFFESDSFSDDVEPTANLRAAKRHQPKAEAASCSRSRTVAEIASKFGCSDVC